MNPRLPTTKNEVVELITEARAALEVVIAETPTDRREEPLSSGLSVKDLLAHITFWERSLLDRLEASATGSDFAALPYEIDADVDAINARVHAQHRSHSWDVLRFDFEEVHRRMVDAIARLSETDLFDPARTQAIIGVDAHTVVERICAETVEHFVEHTAEIQAWLYGEVDVAARTGADLCSVVRPDDTYAGVQGLTYFSGVSAQNVGARALCMHLLKMPPGARARAHLHDDHETAIYLISGKAAMLYGPQLEHHLEMNAGEFLYIPAGAPHLPYNPFDQEAIAVLSRTDPNEQESVRLLPALDARLSAEV
ncbi:MAG: ClbS/DfsB family four-helix bundle protein [Caldilinea sp.]